MSEFPPGTFEFGDRMMGMHVEGARREAKARRLQREAGAAQPHSQRFYSAVLAALGQRLIAWGATLQERHSSEESRPTPARAS